MPLKTIGLAIALAVLGFAFFGYTAAFREEPAMSALIAPLIPACLFFVAGLLGLAPGLRMHAMHAAAALALLLTLAGLGMGLKGAATILSTSEGRPLAVIEQLIMAALSATYLVFAVQSFIAARKARQAGEAAAAAPAPAGDSAH